MGNKDLKNSDKKTWPPTLSANSLDLKHAFIFILIHSFSLSQNNLHILLNLTASSIRRKVNNKSNPRTIWFSM